MTPAPCQGVAAQQQQGECCDDDRIKEDGDNVINPATEWAACPPAAPGRTLPSDNYGDSDDNGDGNDGKSGGEG